MLILPFSIKGAFDPEEPILKRASAFGTCVSRAALNSINGPMISLRCFSCSHECNSNEQNNESKRFAIDTVIKMKYN